MRYIDSGNRDPSHALGTWLGHTFQSDVAEVRWQSGFFGVNGLGLIAEPLLRMSRENKTVRALIGSNDGSTVRRDVERLAAIMGIPRQQAALGIVSYAEGYFHPKTVHMRRDDVSQAAYVGSANLTESGIASLHVEAGITMDSRDGDRPEFIDEIASAVDHWFNSDPPGFYLVQGADDINRLVTNGVLAERAPQRPPIPRASLPVGQARVERPRLRPLLVIPRMAVADQGEPVLAGALRAIVLPATPRPGFPQYLLFAPGQPPPTEGVRALSGSSLPDGVSGLIIQLNRDSARQFAGGEGTANISLPVATLGTFRFGFYVGRYLRPRAEFSLNVRYVAGDAAISVEAARTNIMAYGFLPNEPGHKDVRMLVPARVKELAQLVRLRNRPLPRDGDVALLEWPTTNEAAEFRLTFLENGSELCRQANLFLTHARHSLGMVGEGACWLPSGLSPEW